MTRPARALDHALAHVRAEPSRTWSIIVTLYGDAIVPRGGSVWLGTVLRVFAHLGVGAGVVRTAMSRLASDGWLERHKVGRNSFYALAPRGRQTFRAASEHIYAPPAVPWPGHFDLVLPPPGLDRERVRAAMTGAGFGLLAPDAWVAAGRQAVPDLPGPALRLELRGDAATVRALAARVWPLADMAAAYGRFVDAFTPLGRALDDGKPLADLDALAARVLLVHEFRRIVLRDPLLPAEVLPADWPGVAARQLCAGIYGRVLGPSERWLDAHGVDESGAPLPPAVGLAERFAFGGRLGQGGAG